jgi:AsmA family protein
MLAALTGVVVLLAALAAAAALVDANHLRGPLIRLLAARTGRQIQVDGALELHLLSMTPGLVAEGVAIGNPPWMAAGSTAQIARLSLSFKLLSLLRHSLVIPRLEMQGARLHLLRDDRGRANWQWTPPEGASGKGLPLIQSLSVPAAQVEFEDARRHLQFRGTLSAQDLPSAAGAAPLHIEGEGILNGKPARFALNGDPLTAAGTSQPYRFAFAVRSSHSRLDGRGQLPHALDFLALDLSFEAAGEDLKDLYFLTGLTLPDTAAYHLSGTLMRDDKHFQYNDLKVTSGQSDMHGSVSIDTSQAHARVVADLESQLLRLADLGARAAGRGGPPQSGRPLLLPDVTLPLTGVRHADAVVNFHARGLELGRVALHTVAAHLSIDQGVLNVTGFSASLREGALSGRLRFDASHEVPSAELDLRITDLRLGQFAHKDPTQPPVDGLLQTHLNLTGRGSSIHQLAASANGTVSSVLPHGTIRDSFAELTGVDLVRGLGLLLSKNHENTAVRCAIASFRAHEGTLTAQSLLIDTDPVLITGGGEIHLDSETLDLTLRGQPKSRRLLRLDSPVLVGGTLAHPSVGMPPRSSLVQTGKALTLGIVLTPLEVLGFVDPGLAKNADCAALLAQGSAQGASAK